MTYFAPTCWPQSSLFDGKLLLTDSYTEKTPLNSYLPVIVSTIGYPIVAIVASIYWIYLQIDSYKCLQKSRLIGHKIEYIQGLAHDNVHVLLAFRLQTLQNRLNTLENTRESVVKSLSIQGEITAEKVKEAYYERLSLIDSLAEGVFKRSDRVAELEAQIRVICLYERTQKEIRVYSLYRENTDKLKELLVQRLEFHQLCLKLSQVCNRHLCSNIQISLIPFVGMYFLSESYRTTKVALIESGLIPKYNEAIEQYPWFKPF